MNLPDIRPFFECEYCEKKIVREATFLTHECEKMKRHKICKTKKGINAFNDYTFWLSKKNKIPKLETFIGSKYFTSFVEFQSFCSKQGIPDKKLYMEFMLEKELYPSMWRNKQVFDQFIIHFDHNIAPMQKVNISLKTMVSLSEIFRCELHEVFDNLLPSELSRLIFERKLSPWLLLLSKRFNTYIHTIKDSTQYIVLSSVIDHAEWATIFKKNKEMVKKIKDVVTELNL